MRKRYLNHKLSENFWLYEFIESQLPTRAIELNWLHIDEMRYDEFKKLAEYLQQIRNEVNSVFKDKNKQIEIGLNITSGFRCKAWEALRGRSGTSQHTVRAAADIQPINCDNELAVEILDWLFEQDKDREKGHQGGLAIKYPTRDKDGNILAVGFIHYDLRPHAARWEY